MVDTLKKRDCVLDIWEDARELIIQETRVDVSREIILGGEDAT